MNAVLRGAGELAVALDGLDFVLAHQELEAFGVFADDFGLAVLHRFPVQLARGDALDAEFLGIFQVVPDFGVEQQGFRRDAAHVQAGAAQVGIFFDECSLEPYCPARMAAVYPAGPLPITAMS